MSRRCSHPLSNSFTLRFFHPRPGLFLLAAVFLLLGFPTRSFSAAPNRFPAVNNCTFWALGVDYAWNNWGTDFGSSPLWSGTGKGSTCTGLPANWVANMTSAANYANSKGMRGPLGLER